MSLKAIHLIFVTLLTVLTLGCGVWKLRSYFSEASASGDLWWAVISFLAAIAVVCYGRYFLKKLKAISFV
jgi:hypothetical protein